MPSVRQREKWFFFRLISSHAKKSPPPPTEMELLWYILGPLYTIRVSVRYMIGLIIPLLPSDMCSDNN